MRGLQIWKWTKHLWLGFVCFSFIPTDAFSQITNLSLPEPGPENGGVRLRFSVETTRSGTNDTHQVRIDLINVTDKPIRLLGDWPGDQSGPYEEYLESDVSIHTDPPFMPFMGQVGVERRRRPQPAFTLAAHEVLTVRWAASGRRLKNKSIHPVQTHDPFLTMDGLYAVYASLLLRPIDAETALETDLMRRTWSSVDSRSREERLEDFPKASAESSPHGTIYLRSNEQLVPIGGSRMLPKPTLARLVWTDTNHDVATINFGSAQKIDPGDAFWIPTGYIGNVWRLEITNVAATSSSGLLTPISREGRVPVDSKVLVYGSQAELILKSDWRYRWFNLTN